MPVAHPGLASSPRQGGAFPINSTMKKTKPIPIPVCYKECFSDVIKWTNAIRVEGKKKNLLVRFDDGQWRYAEDCFFTEQQCRDFYGMPPKDWYAINDGIADSLYKMANHIRNIKL